MGIHFKEFCDSIRDLSGRVFDVIDMTTAQKDQAVIALLRDENQTALADLYTHMSDAGKNSCYQSVEWIIRDAIDNYNLAADMLNEHPKLVSAEIRA